MRSKKQKKEKEEDNEDEGKQTDRPVDRHQYRLTD